MSPKYIYIRGSTPHPTGENILAGLGGHFMMREKEREDRERQ